MALCNITDKSSEKNAKGNSLGNFQRRNGIFKEIEKGVVRKIKGNQNITMTDCQWKTMLKKEQ